jgi:hypothetical protein
MLSRTRGLANDHARKSPLSTSGRLRSRRVLWASENLRLSVRTAASPQRRLHREEDVARPWDTPGHVVAIDGLTDVLRCPPVNPSSSDVGAREMRDAGIGDGRGAPAVVDELAAGLLEREPRPRAGVDEPATHGKDDCRRFSIGGTAQADRPRRTTSEPIGARSAGSARFRAQAPRSRGPRRSSPPAPAPARPR